MIDNSHKIQQYIRDAPHEVRQENLSVTFCSKGEIRFIEYIVDGNHHGLQRAFNAKGTLIKETNYNNGLKTGISKSYHDDGTIKQETRYRDEILNGCSRCFGKKGNIKMQKDYINGTLMKIVSWKNGRIRTIEFPE